MCRCPGLPSTQPPALLPSNFNATDIFLNTSVGAHNRRVGKQPNASLSWMLYKLMISVLHFIWSSYAPDHFIFLSVCEDPVWLRLEAVKTEQINLVCSHHIKQNHCFVLFFCGVQHMFDKIVCVIKEERTIQLLIMLGNVSSLMMYQLIFKKDSCIDQKSTSNDNLVCSTYIYVFFFFLAYQTYYI